MGSRKGDGIQKENEGGKTGGIEGHFMDDIEI